MLRPLRVACYVHLWSRVTSSYNLATAEQILPEVFLKNRSLQVHWLVEPVHGMGQNPFLSPMFLARDTDRPDMTFI